MKSRTLSMALLALNAFAAAANEDLNKAVTQRSQQFPTIDVRFRIRETTTQKSRFVPPDRVVPGKELVWESENRWVRDGEKYRYERNHPIGNMYGGRTSGSMKLTSDGRIHKQISDFSNSFQHLSGFIENERSGLPDWDAFCRPLAIHFRGDDPEVLGCLFSELRQVKSQAKVNEIPCEVFEAKLSASTAQLLWFDPARDWVLVRLEWKSPGHRYVMEIDYAEHAEFGLMPNAWRIDELDREGKVKRKTQVNVLSATATIPNPQSTFDLAFPPHSLVSDQRPARPIEYRVNPDGKLIELDILGTPVGSSVLPVAVRVMFLRYRMLILAGSLVGITLVLAYLTRRGLRSRHRAPPVPPPVSELPFV